MERVIRGGTFAFYGLIACGLFVGATRTPPLLGLPLLVVAVVGAFRVGHQRPPQGQPAPSPRWARATRVALATGAVAVEVGWIIGLRHERGGWIVMPEIGLVVAVTLLVGVSRSESRRNAITLLPLVWIIEVIALSAFIFPGIFVAATTFAATFSAALPDGRGASPRQRRPPATPERWVLRAAITMIGLGTTSLLFWWTAA